MVVPDSGTLKFKNENIANGWQYRSQIGYMPQIGRYPENMKIGQVMEMLADIRASVHQVDEDLINAFALKKLYHKRMGNTTGCQRQN